MGDTLARIARMHEFRLLLATLALALLKKRLSSP